MGTMNAKAWAIFLVAVACSGCTAMEIVPEQVVPEQEAAWNDAVLQEQKENAYNGHSLVVQQEQAARSYAGHSLVQFTLESPEERDAFNQAVAKRGIDVWEEGPLNHGASAHVVARVPPSVNLAEMRLKHRVISHDLEPVLLEEAQPAGEGFHQRYHSAAEVEDFAQQLAKKHPTIVRVEQIGHSFERRPISVVHVAAAGQESKTAPIVFVQAGQHAREWIGPAAAMAALQDTVKTAVADGGLPGYQLSMALLVNPDGYQYTRDKDRMWRKNRNPKAPPKPKRKPWQSIAVYEAMTKGSGDCHGVDLNRNWGGNWGQTLQHGKVKQAKADPCSNEFHGTSAMSEPEIQALTKHIAAHKKRIKAFLDVHSYSQRLLPPGCNGFPISDKDTAEQLRVARIVAKTMSEVKGAAQYQTGPCTKEMYACAGTAPDWAFHKAGILHSYCLELRPTMKEGAGRMGANGFVLPPAQIVTTGAELLAGINTLGSEAIRATSM